MSLFPYNPNAGQKIQGSEAGNAPSIPALGMGFIAHWSKSPFDDDDNNDLVSLHVLPNTGTDTVTLVPGQDQQTTIDPGGATSGQFNLKWNGGYMSGGGTANAVYKVDVGTSTGGTFALTVDGQTLATEAYNISAATLQSDIAGLSSVGAGNVTVTGTGTSADPWVITFVNDKGAIPITASGDGTNLTGGNHTLTVTSFVTGVGIAYNASAATVQAGIQTITGLSGATVSGTGPWVVSLGINKAGPNFTVPKDKTSGGTGVTATITQNSGTLDVARNVTAKGNAGGIAGNVVVTGTNLNGETITETIALSGTALVAGNKAFATVTTVQFPAKTNGSGDKCSIGVGDKLGLHHTMPYNTLFSKHTFLNFVLEGTEPTVAVDKTHVELNTFTLNSDLTGAQVDTYYIVGT